MSNVLIITNKQFSILDRYYTKYKITTSNQYVKQAYKLPYLTITVYTSNKVVFQGKNAESEVLIWERQFSLQPQKKDKIKHVEHNIYSSSAIGSDEVGTGDFFGPIVVCACFIDQQMIPELESLGVKDSKLMKDKEIVLLGTILKNKIPHSILIVNNRKYNNLTHNGYNMNKIKAYLHNHAINKCIQKTNKSYDYVVVDKFCSEKNYFNYLIDYDDVYKNISFYEKGESVHLSVAAASIIARTTFVQLFDELSKQSGYALLKGAGKQVDQLAAAIIKEKGVSYLDDIAKTNFKTLNKAKMLL